MPRLIVSRRLKIDGHVHGGASNCAAAALVGAPDMEGYRVVETGSVEFEKGTAIFRIWETGKNNRNHFWFPFVFEADHPSAMGRHSDFTAANVLADAVRGTMALGMVLQRSLPP
jgi:hypothetical protein